MRYFLLLCAMAFSASLAFSQNRLFVGSTNLVLSIDTQGNDQIAHAVDGGSIYWVAVDDTGQHIYWVDEGYSRILRVAPDGSKPQVLFTTADGLVSPKGLVHVETLSMIFWADPNGTGAIYRGNADGRGAPTKIYDTTNGVCGDPSAITYHSTTQTLLWTCATDNKIQTGDVNGHANAMDIYNNGFEKTAITVDPLGSNIYWTDNGSGEIVQGSVDGTDGPTVLYDFAGDQVNSPVGIAYHSDTNMLHWTENDSEIVTADTSGTDNLTVTYTGTMSGLAIDPLSDNIYWTTKLNEELKYGSSLSVSNPTLLLFKYEGEKPGSATGAVVARASGENYIFWPDSANRKLKYRRYGRDTDTNDDADLGGTAIPKGVVADPANSRLFFIDKSKVKMSPLTNLAVGNFTTIFEALNSPEDLAVDPEDNMLYWTDPQSNAIFRSDIDTQNAEKLFDDTNDGLVDPHGIDIDLTNEWVYWTDSSAGRIQRGRLDGSGSVETLFALADGLLRPTDVAVDPSAGKIYWIDSHATKNKVQSGNADGSGSPTDLLINIPNMTKLSIAFDSDSDSIYNESDNCVDTSNRTQSDTDGDGIGNACDVCPNSGDTDSDGTQDCQDECDFDEFKSEAGACGCGNLETDTDEDSTPDCNDECDSDASKNSSGVCGCGLFDKDTNFDGKIEASVDCNNDSGEFQINSGSSYTNTESVTLSVLRFPNKTVTVRISNDGGFVNATDISPPKQSIDWNLEPLTQTGDVTSRTVLMRFLDENGNTLFQAQDSIDLDTFPPTIDQAKAIEISKRRKSNLICKDGESIEVTYKKVKKALKNGATLGPCQNDSELTSSMKRGSSNRVKSVQISLSATDEETGIDTLRVEQSGKPLTQWIPFAKKTKVTARPGKITIKVRDRAGNISKEQVVKIRKTTKRNKKTKSKR